jgi:hypothetical protein
VLDSYHINNRSSGCDVVVRKVILRRDVKHEMPGKITHEKVVARIGTKPLTLEERE